MVGKDFIALFTKGTGDDTKVCQLMVIPANFVAKIVDLGTIGHPNGDNSKSAAESHDGELKL